MSVLLNNLYRIKFAPILYWSLGFKSMVVAGSCFLVLLFGYFMFLENNWSMLDELKQKQADLKLEFEHKQNKALAFNGYNAQLEELRGRYEDKKYNQMLPKLSEIDQLLADISKLGQQDDLVFSLFDPLDKEKKDIYTELPIKISILGKYENIVKFLNELSLLKQIVTINSLELITTIPKTLDNHDRSDNAVEALFLPHALQINILAKAYYSNDEHA